MNEPNKIKVNCGVVVPRGVLQPTDLIQELLKWMRNKCYDIYEMVMEDWRDYLPHTGEYDILISDKFLEWTKRETEEAEKFYYDLTERLNEYAPEGCWFGRNLDGDLGFWKRRESKNSVVLIKVKNGTVTEVSCTDAGCKVFLRDYDTQNEKEYNEYFFEWPETQFNDAELNNLFDEE